MSQTIELAGKSRRVVVGRALVWVIFGAAVVVGALALVLRTIDIVTSLATGQVQLTLVAQQELPGAAHGGSASIISGSYESASISATGFSPRVVILSTVALIAGAVTQVALAATVAMIAWRIVRGSPFRASLSRDVTLGGATLLAGGLIGQLANSLATGTAATELNASGLRGFWPLAGRFDATPLVIGGVLLLVGLAFEYGERLQRDTEGLV